MQGLSCNIEQKERTHRVVIGVLLILGGLLSLGSYFLLLMGFGLVLSGVVGWCAIPLLQDKLKSFLSKSES